MTLCSSPRYSARPIHALRIGVVAAAVACAPFTAYAAEAGDPGFYVSVRVGGSVLENMNFAESTTANLGLDPDTGYAINGAIGYGLGNGIRLELDLGYGGNDIKGTFQQNVQAFVPCGEFANNPCLDPNVNGDIGALSGFAMAYYDFPNIGRLMPYAGIGVGFVNVDLDVGARATMNDGPVSRFAIIDGSDTVIGYRGTVGLKYDFGLADVSVGYTYTATDWMNVPGRGTLVNFDFDRRVSAHTLAAGVSYQF
jgi:opacity protein-like surface antigen